MQEGLRPGQRLLSISDPIRTSDEWEISTTTSLSRIRDAIQFRRPHTISFQFSVASVEDDSDWSMQKASLWVCRSMCIVAVGLLVSIFIAPFWQSWY